MITSTTGEHDRPPVATPRGATAVEYALLASLIAAVIVVVVVAFGGDVVDLFETVDL